MPPGIGCNRFQNAPPGRKHARRHRFARRRSSGLSNRRCSKAPFPPRPVCLVAHIAIASHNSCYQDRRYPAPSVCSSEINNKFLSTSILWFEQRFIRQKLDSHMGSLTPYLIIFGRSRVMQHVCIGHKKFRIIADACPLQASKTQFPPLRIIGQTLLD